MFDSLARRSKFLERLKFKCNPRWKITIQQLQSRCSSISKVKTPDPARSMFFFVFVTLIGLAFGGQPALLPYNPKANPNAVVLAGNNVRFTVLTPQVIRVERITGGTFLDQATVAFLNRYFDDVPNFSQTINNGVLSIKTDYLLLTYTIGAPFSAQSLQIQAVDNSFVWSYGQLDDGNLFGTIKSLDELDIISLNCTENANHQVHDESLHCEVLFCVSFCLAWFWLVLVVCRGFWLNGGWEKREGGM